MSSPWFKCYPGDFLSGLSGLTVDEQAFYVQLVLRMYDAADAIYVDDKRIARWCGSNVRKWLRVKEALIEDGKLTILSDGGLINKRALEEMTKNLERLPEAIQTRLTKLSQMFDESLGKVSRKISQTSPEKPLETKPFIEARSQKLDNTLNAGAKLDQMLVRQKCFEAAGLKDADCASSPGLVSTVQIYNLLYPESGEPCDLEQDVIPAIQVCAAKLKTRNSKFTSWGYCHAAIIENRDRRIAGVPPVQQQQSRSSGRGSGVEHNPARRLLESLQGVQAGQDHNRSVQSEDEGFVYEHEPMAAAGNG